MTTLENLRARKLQLEQDLRKISSEEQRDWIEGELTKIDLHSASWKSLPQI
jgi:hypothetical protein